MGFKFDYSGRKRCIKGKSCGATCINKSKACLKELGSVQGEVIKLRGKLKEKPKFNKPELTKGLKDVINPEPAKRESTKGELPSGDSSKRANFVLNYLSDPDVKSKDVDGELSANKVNWRSGIENGAKFVAGGASADFIIVQPDSLAKGLQSRFPNGVGIKYGKITSEEVELSKKIGESGAGPKVIAARFEDKGKGKVVEGMIALERIPGKTVDKMIDEGKTSRATLNDAYLKGLALLHRSGISHGDAHFSNAIFQPNGKVRFIDFGFSKDDPDKAFSEALRRGFSLSEGQVSARMKENFKKVLQKLGRSDIKSEMQLRLELDSIVPKSDPNRNKTLMNLISILYDGI